MAHREEGRFVTMMAPNAIVFISVVGVLYNPRLGVLRHIIVIRSDYYPVK